MKTEAIFKRVNCIRVWISLLCLSGLLVGSVLRVSAASWTDKSDDVYEMLYGQGDESEDVSEPVVEEEEPGMVEDFFSGLLTSLSIQLNNLLSSHDINLSIDGIVFGRMAASITGSGFVKADFTHFGLEENNPWGIIGATIFYSLRSLCLVVLPIVLLALLILQLFQNSGKGRARLKELAMYTVYVFGLLFILPYALDLFIYFRDVVLYSVYRAMNGLVVSISGAQVNSSVGVVDMMLQIQDGRILNALVLLASVFAGLFFLVDYIRIALILTLSFGLFPLIAVMSFWNHKKLSEWSNVFFPNLLVPFIDMLLVLIPTILNALFVRLFGNGLNSVLVGVIILIVIWNVVMVRNRVVRLLGFDGMGGGGGFGQMLEILSHLRPHHKKEEEKKEKPKPDKEKNNEKSSYAESGTYPERASYGNEGMSPAVSDVLNQDSEMEELPQKEPRAETDILLAGMHEQTDAEYVNRNTVSEAIPAGEDMVSSVGVPDHTDVLQTENEEARSVTPEPVAGTTQGPVHASIDSTDMGGSLEPVPNDKEARTNGEGGLEPRKNKEPNKVRETAKNVVKASAKMAVGGAMGVVGTFAAGYGGMGTSVGTGIVAAHGGSRLVEGTFDAKKHAPETIEEGKKHVKEAVLAAYRRDYETFVANYEGFDFEMLQKGAKRKADRGVKEAAKKRAALEREARNAYKAADEKAHKDFVD